MQVVRTPYIVSTFPRACFSALEAQVIQCPALSISAQTATKEQDRVIHSHLHRFFVSNWKRRVLLLADNCQMALHQAATSALR